MASKAKWTFMVYMAGDNNLSSAGDADLREMRKVGSTADVNVVTQFDNAGDVGTKRYIVQRDRINERVESLGETDSGDPKVLIDFVAWTRAEYPAERYALVLWNHGGGWEPTEMDRVARSVNSPQFNFREASERQGSPLGRAFFRTTLEKIFQLPTPTERAICSDDGSGHSLDTIELDRVMAEVVRDLGQPLDLLGMDACLMSNLEVAYQMQPYVRYIAASEETEPNQGWPYEEVLRRVVDQPTLATADFAAHIVKAYVQSYITRGYTEGVTQAALDLAYLPDLAAPVDRLADALSARLPAAYGQIIRARNRTRGFHPATLRDLKSFCIELRAKLRTSVLQQAAKATEAALLPGVGKLLLAEEHYGPSVQNCAGMSLYLPIDSISPYYGDLAFARQQRWLAFLEALMA